MNDPDAMRAAVADVQTMFGSGKQQLCNGNHSQPLAVVPARRSISLISPAWQTVSNNVIFARLRPYTHGTSLLSARLDVRLTAASSCDVAFEPSVMLGK